MHAEFALAAVNFIRVCGLTPRTATLPARASWLQQTARRLLRVLRIEVNSSGPTPTTGLLVCNHLSYLDILVLASLSPTVFVAKREVKYWPIFGWFAQLAGTIFVQRNRRFPAAQAAAEITAVLRSGTLVVLFPEGTSSGGSTILPFKTSLLEPALRPDQPLTIACLSYELSDGDVADEVCYWRDMTLVPHLINLLGKKWVRAAVQFLPVQNRAPNRKALATQLHAEMVTLNALSAFAPPEICRTPAARPRRFSVSTSGLSP
jgi:1-acyl-sn-glycerol-3-phosphate acyltransferase